MSRVPNMKNYVIDVDCLITLVQEKPVVWDKTMLLYKDRNETKKAWKDICSQLFSEFEDLEDNEQYNFIKTVMKKWTNVRDAFQKSRKKHKEIGSVKIKPYVYESQLQFLLKDDANLQNEDSISSDVQNASEQFLESAPPEDETPEKVVKQRNRKRKLETLDPVELKVLDVLNEKPNRHLCFFKGIIPTLATFDDDDVIEFQMGVLNTIKTIKERKKSSAQRRNRIHDSTTQQDGNVTAKEASEAVNTLRMFLGEASDAPDGVFSDT